MFPWKLFFIFTICFFVVLIFLRIFRWKVRIFDASENAKEGWLPADVLDTQHTEQAIFGEKADDAAYRREWVLKLFIGVSLTLLTFYFLRLFIIIYINFYYFRAVIRELVETEEEFGRDLQAVVDRYIKAIDDPDMKVPRIVRDNKELIFMNFKPIAEFHNS